MNDRPQRTEIKKRLGPSSGGGYDFHKSMTLHARRYIVGGEAFVDVLASANTIARLPERQSAVAALGRLEDWRLAMPGEILDFGATIFESPRHLFRVRFEPAFSIRMNGRPTAIHIWNTMRPPLAAGPTYAALSLAGQAYQTQPNRPNDVGVLSLRPPVALYLLSDVSDAIPLATSLVTRIEELIRGTPPVPPQPEDRPAA